MNDMYLGVIEALGFSFVPRNFGACGGALITIAQNQALFSLLGTAFGGDGRVNFSLPDMRGRIPMGFGTGPGLPSRVMGQRVGVESVTLTTANLPAHTHAHTYAGGGGSGGSAQVEVAKAGGKKQLPDTGDYLAAPADNFSSVTSNLYIAPQDMSGVTTVPLGGVSGGGGGFDSASFAIQNTGNGLPFDIVQPCTVINYCICMQGLFPSRS